MSTPSLRLCAGAALLLVASASAASAQTATYRGTAACTKSGCHDKEKKWFDEEDGPPPNQHKQGYAQLTRDVAKSTKYASAIGLSDPQKPDGRCVECHAPRQRSRFVDGVSCEVCHGAGSAYYDPHDDEPYMTAGYVKAQGLGMPAFINNPTAWVEKCLGCHAVKEAALIAAGHPDGKDPKKSDYFDLAVKYRTVASPNSNHWKTDYRSRTEEIRALARKFTPALTTSAAPPPPPPPPPPLPRVPTTTEVTPPQTPEKTAVAMPPPPGGNTDANLVTPQQTVRITIPMPPKPSPPVDPVPPPVRRARTTSAVARRSTPQPSAPPPAAAPAPTPPARAAATPATPSPQALADALPKSPAAQVAAVQGRAITVLNSLLQRGAVVPARVRPAEPAIRYTGPDAELLSLQREAVALALDALGVAPAAPAAPQSQPKK